MEYKVGDRVHSLDAAWFFNKVDKLSGWIESQNVSLQLEGGEFTYAADGPDGTTEHINPNDPPIWMDDLVADVILAHWKSGSEYYFLNAICDYLSLRYAVCIDTSKCIWEMVNLDGVTEYVYAEFDGYHQVVEMDRAISEFNYGWRPEDSYTDDEGGAK